MAADSLCVVDGCGRSRHSKGLCALHYRRQWDEARRTGKKRRLPIICFVPECTELATRQGACKRHYNSIRQVHRLRTDPAFKAYRRGYVDAYVESHPEYHQAHITKSRRVTRWYAMLAKSCTNDAKRAGYTCTINDAYLLALWEKQNGKCHWLGIPMTPSIETRHPLRPSVDKLDPAKGYTPGNVVLCSMFANMGRNNFPAERFAEVVAEIRRAIRE